jgi:hypothetical protein
MQTAHARMSVITSPFAALQILPTIIARYGVDDERFADGDRDEPIRV